MAKALGIDFGTEFCRIAVVDATGRTDTLASAQEQERKTPCAVGFDNAWLWGWSAAGRADRVVWDLREELVRHGPASTPRHVVKERGYSAEDLVCEFFRQLRQSMLEGARELAVLPCVLAVPYSFGIRHRELLRRAVENAGFSVRGVINDAEAVLLGYGTDRAVVGNDVQTGLIFDVGALSTQISVVEVKCEDQGLSIDLVARGEAPGFRHVQAKVLAAVGSPNNSDCPPCAVCPRLGPALVHAATRHSDATFGGNGDHFVVTADCVGATMAEWQLEVDDAMSRTLASAGLQPRDLDFAAPAGGACEIDGVRNGVSHFSRVLGPSGATTIEDVCARGAARYASMLADASDPVQFRSAQVPAVGLEVAKGSFDRILDINHTRGARSFRIYTPADASSEVMSVKVLQGFARVADSNTPLQPGPFEIALSPADSLVKVEATQIDDLKVRIRLVYGNHTVQKDMELV